jgi:biotin operon repressor
MTLITPLITLDMTERERLAASYLERHQGKDRPLARERLAALLGVTTREVERLVKHLVERHGCPIGSVCAGDRHGYYTIVDEADLARTADNLRARAMSLLKRLARLRQTTELDVLGQLRLDLESELTGGSSR